MRHTIIASIFCQFHIAQQVFGSAFVPSPRPVCEVCWPSGVHQDATILNVDGGALSNCCQTDFGGLIRKHDDSFHFGFYGPVCFMQKLNSCGGY